MTLIEALLSGLPHFVPAVGGIAEVYVDDEDGLFILLDDTAFALQKIIDWLDDDEWVKKAACVASRKYYLDFFENITVAMRLIGFLEEHPARSEAKQALNNFELGVNT